MKKTIIIALIGILLFLAFLSYRKNHEEEIFDRKVREIAGIEGVEDFIIEENEAQEDKTQGSEAQIEKASDGETTKEKTSNTYDSLKGGDMRVNFEKLKELNPDIVAWIYSPETRINYPVVKSEDDPDYYLRRGLDGKYNSHGCIYTRKGDFPGRAAIIYGHNMRDGTMFGTADLFLEEGTEGSEGSEISEGSGRKLLIFLPGETRSYSFHSAYIEEPFDLEDMFNRFLSEEDVKDYLSYVADRSGKDVSPESSIITLSTCTPDGNERLIVNFICGV